MNSGNIAYHISSFFKSEPYWNFPEIIDIENKYRVKSTFFFMHESFKFNFFKLSNWKLSLGRYKLTQPAVNKIIQHLDSHGWEIGLHGSYLSYKDFSLLKSEKSLLEEILGHPVAGVRQHYLNLCDETWKYQNQLGFKYDSSFGYRDNIGFKENKYLPFNPLNNEFVVFPQIIMDSCIFGKKNRWLEFKKLCDLTEKTGGVLVVNWHQRNFNKQEFPGYPEFYEKMIIELKERNAAFKTLAEYYEDFK